MYQPLVKPTPIFGNCLRHGDIEYKSSSDELITSESIASVTGGTIAHCDSYIDTVMAAVQSSPFLTKLFKLFLTTDPQFKIGFAKKSIGLGHYEMTPNLIVVREDIPNSANVFVHELMHAFLKHYREKIFSERYLWSTNRIFDNLDNIKDASANAIQDMYDLIVRATDLGLDQLSDYDLKMYTSLYEIAEKYSLTFGSGFYVMTKRTEPDFKRFELGETYSLSMIDFSAYPFHTKYIKLNGKIDSNLTVVKHLDGPEDRFWTFFEADDPLVAMVMRLYMSRVALNHYISKGLSTVDEEFVVRAIECTPHELLNIVYPDLLPQLNTLSDRALKDMTVIDLKGPREIDSDYVPFHRYRLMDMQMGYFRVFLREDVEPILDVADQVLLSGDRDDYPTVVTTIKKALHTKNWNDEPLENMLNGYINTLTQTTCDESILYPEEGGSWIGPPGARAASDNPIQTYSTSQFINEQLCLVRLICHWIGKLLPSVSTRLSEPQSGGLFWSYLSNTTPSDLTETLNVLETTPHAQHPIRTLRGPFKGA